MTWIADGVLLLSLYPMALALRANWTTTLRQPIVWALLAWCAWLVASGGWAAGSEAGDPTMSYLALCLTGCSGVAVLGARRPGVSAWNFVVVGLLAVLMLPILQGLGEVRLESAQAGFLALTLMIPLFNYLPTRLALGVILLAAGSAIELARLLGWNAPAWLAPLLAALAPWSAWLSLARRTQHTPFDILWLSYRDRFGFVWGQRMRDQFNRAAHHAGWPVELRWSGLNPPTDSAEMLSTLRAVLKRFGPEEESSHSR
jgi:hypothetical protein